MLLYTRQIAMQMKGYAKQALLSGVLLLVPLAAVSAYAQGMPGIQEVSGTYVNEDLGVEISFPDGWSGFEIAQTSDTTLVATSPGGMSEGDPETMKTISLLVTGKGGRDPNEPSSLTQDVIDCNQPSIGSRTVAGVQGTEVTVECPASNQKWRMVAIETVDTIVAVMFMSPASEFDSSIAAFDSAVSSLKVQGTVSTGGIPSTPSEQEPTTSMQSVTVSGESIEVSVESLSTVSDFALSEESKTLSFKTDGTGSETTVGVGRVLEGPYTVMLDGQATTSYTESTASDGTKMITTAHGSGAHQVTITGTQVVPEFPIIAIGAILAVVGLVGVMGRTRIFRM